MYRHSSPCRKIYRHSTQMYRHSSPCRTGGMLAPGRFRPRAGGTSCSATLLGGAVPTLSLVTADLILRAGKRKCKGQEQAVKVTCGKRCPAVLECNLNYIAHLLSQGSNFLFFGVTIVGRLIIFRLQERCFSFVLFCLVLMVDWLCAPKQKNCRNK